LYLVLPTADLGTQTISLQVVVNPLVNWIWVGFGVLAFGTVIALLPESSFAFAMSRLPADAATTTAALVLALLLSAAARPVFAQQHVDSPRGAVLAPRNALEKQLRDEMGCICGTCAHEP